MNSKDRSRKYKIYPNKYKNTNKCNTSMANTVKNTNNLSKAIKTTKSPWNNTQKQSQASILE